MHFEQVYTVDLLVGVGSEASLDRVNPPIGRCHSLGISLTLTFLDFLLSGGLLLDRTILRLYKRPIADPDELLHAFLQHLLRLHRPTAPVHLDWLYHLRARANDTNLACSLYNLDVTSIKVLSMVKPEV